jgi:two-component system, OmpR family, response regulator
MYTVFIVDDDPAIQEIFTTYLKLEGFDAVAMSGGNECLTRLATRSADLILLDMTMKPIDGWQTLMAIRQYPSATHIPVIMITGKLPVPENIIQFGGLIEDFIVKPVDFGKVVASFRHTIETTKDLDQIAAQKKEDGYDPLSVAEYIRLLRLVRITHFLIKRFSEIQWAYRISLQKQEEQLKRLHSLLDFPDYLLAWREGIEGVKEEVSLF